MARATFIARSLLKSTSFYRTVEQAGLRTVTTAKSTQFPSYPAHTHAASPNLRSPFRRLCSSGQSGTSPPGLTNAEVKHAVDNISDKFAEALAQLADARSSAGTIYFSEDVKDAEELVRETLDDYQKLLDSLDGTQRTNVTRAIGLKMEELKAQMKLLKELAEDRKSK